MKLCKHVLLFAFFCLTACQTSPSSNELRAANLEQSGVSRLAKSDIDEVVEIHQRVVMTELKKLMVKLYHRNPGQRFDKDRRTIEESVDLVFKRPYSYGYKHWESLSGTDMIRLSVDPSYHVNDRVLPFIVGLRKMLMASYDYQTSFYMLSSLDEQKLYNSARNIEIAAWLLAERRDEQNRLLILSDSLQHETRNLSFQRLFGSMITTQDNLASIISHKEGRLIKTVVIRAASLVFLPI